MTTTLDEGRLYYLELALDGRVFDERALGGVLEEIGFGPVSFALSDKSEKNIGFLAKPQHDIALKDTPLGRWALVWPLALDAASGLNVFPQTFALAPGVTYDMRFLAKEGSQNLLHQALSDAGFDLLCGPILLKNHIWHPALPGGKLTSWIARGLWKGLPSEIPNMLGPLLLEQVIAVKDSP